MVSHYTNADSNGNPLDVEEYNNYYFGHRQEDTDMDEANFIADIEENKDGECSVTQIPVDLVHLKYYPPSNNSMSPVEPPIPVLVVGNKVMKNVVVGTILAGEIDFDEVERIIMTEWAAFGLLDVGMRCDGSYIFHFETMGGDGVLALNYWQFGNCPTSLKARKDDPKIHVNPSTTRLWVKFTNVYWSEDGLSYLAKATGEPLYADAKISTFQISAHICIHFVYGNPMPDFVNDVIIHPKLRKKDVVRVLVAYPHVDPS